PLSNKLPTNVFFLSKVSNEVSKPVALHTQSLFTTTSFSLFKFERLFKFLKIWKDLSSLFTFISDILFKMVKRLSSAALIKSSAEIIGSGLRFKHIKG